MPKARISSGEKFDAHGGGDEDFLNQKKTAPFDAGQFLAQGVGWTTP